MVPSTYLKGLEQTGLTDLTPTTVQRLYAAGVSIEDVRDWAAAHPGTSAKAFLVARGLG